MKGKVNSAMSFGVPVVATTVAVEAMFPRHGSNVLVADSPDEIARAVAGAYGDPRLWAQLRRGGRETLEARFSTERAAEGMAAMVGAVLGRGATGTGGGGGTSPACPCA